MFRAGISDPVNTVLAWYMARAAGFFAAQGLEVDIVNMQGGSRGAAELQAGRLDAMHVGLSSVIRVNRAGGDIRSVASLSNVIRFTFFSAPGVKSASDLKGGVIGVGTFGSESDATVTLAMQRLRLTRDDVVLKEYGGGMRRLEAVKSGEIKATPINEPIASLARAQGANVLVDLVPEESPGCSAPLWCAAPTSLNGAARSQAFSRARSREIISRLPIQGVPSRSSRKS